MALGAFSRSESYTLLEVGLGFSLQKGLICLISEMSIYG